MILLKKWSFNMCHTYIFVSEKIDILEKKLLNGGHLGFFSNVNKKWTTGPILKNLTFLSLSHPTVHFNTKCDPFLFEYKNFDFFWRPSWIFVKKSMFLYSNFVPFLVCCRLDPTWHKTTKKQNIAIFLGKSVYWPLYIHE